MILYGNQKNETFRGSEFSDIIHGGLSYEIYQSSVLTLSEQRVAVAGYVYSGYGKRSVTEVIHDISLMHSSFESMEWIFIDETSTSMSDYETYEALCSYAHSLGLSVILNPGITVSDERFFTIADVIVVGENNEDVSQNILDTIALGYSPSKIAALEYAINPQSVLSETQKLFDAGAGYVYLTEDGAKGKNPWDSVSASFEEELLIAQSTNQKILLPLYSYPDNNLWNRAEAGGESLIAIINPSNGPMSGKDKLYGESGEDELYGYDGKDILFGGFDNDHLYGGSGNDQLYGEEGDDYIEGGSGIDRLSGGNGADRFVFGALHDSYKNQRDTITDFTITEGDQIDLLALNIEFNDLRLVAQGKYKGVLYVDIEGNDDLSIRIISVGTPLSEILAETTFIF